ncbi:MAG: hypothetical protein IPG35_11325 [Flavobacteriales bacterium]|jgi:hypothetical protein|nr:hypothetical protein [Flavobacteriales bacterium]MBK8949822.1 hypothetical protein [Flavobacteriales bacterium]MBK9700272.1 hypothetical protein [Flavobacteriales bacterium]
MRTTLIIAVLLASAACPAQSIQGPDAPDLIVGRSGTALSFTLTDPRGSNNINGSYVEAFVPVDPTPDPAWRFQGYLIMELRSPADADDSLALVVSDLQRAHVLALMDKVDTVEAATALFILGTDSCFVGPVTLHNTDLFPQLDFVVSAFTGQPFHEDSTYCFVALAFATTPSFTDPICGQPRTMLWSQRSTSGALIPVCVTPGTIGIAEPEGERGLHVFPVPATEQVHVQAPRGDWTVECTDALGALVHTGPLRDRGALAVAGWVPGVYTLLLRGDGTLLHTRFVVH